MQSLKNLVNNFKNLKTIKFLYIAIFCFFILLPIFFSIKAEFYLLLISILIILVINKFLKTDKNYMFYLIIFTFISRLLIILFVENVPVSDFKTLFDASQSVLKNDFSFLDLDYFVAYPYQIGIVLFQSLILLLNNSLFFLKLVTITIICANFALIFKIIRKITNDKIALITTFFYSIMPFSLLYSNVISNQHVFSLLALIAINIFLNKKENELKTIFLIGIILAFANVLRPEAITIVFSIVLYYIFMSNKQKMKSTCLSILILLISYYGTFNATSYLLSKTRFSNNGLKGGNSTWKFVLGLNSESCGSYNNNDLIYFNDEVKAKEIIIDRFFSNPKSIIIRSKCKIQSFWATTDLNWSFNSDKPVNLQKQRLLENLNNFMFLFTILLMFIGIIYNIKKFTETKLFLLVSIIFVTFGIYLFIEVQPRYVYFVQIIIVILSSFGFQKLLKSSSV